LKFFIEGYYLINNKNKYINIKDKKGNTLIRCMSDGVCDTVDYGDDNSINKFYLNAKTNTVIACKDNCILKEDTIKGYFVNSGLNDNKFIRCNANKNRPCYTINGESSCLNNVGKILDTFNLCVSTNVEKGFSLEETIKQEFLTIAKDDDFPGAKEGLITVKMTKNESIILLEGKKKNFLLIL